MLKPYHNVLLTNSSFAPTPARNDNTHHVLSDSSDATASAFLMPSFQYVPAIPTDSAGAEAFIEAFILPSQLHQSRERLSRAEQNVLLRQPEIQQKFIGARKVDEILVLICGHGGRDVRCGTLGPILKQEFEEKLERQNIELLKDPPVAEAVEVDTAVEGYTPTARVGLISHVGGHKWAGNVIIYIPPSFGGNALAGKGIWYGRVEPGHVEGIVAKTILGGKVIKEPVPGRY